MANTTEQQATDTTTAEDLMGTERYRAVLEEFAEELALLEED